MEHTVTIEKLITGGLGLARLEDGRIIMVPFVLPGETILVEEATVHAGYITGKLLQVIQPSPSRVQPSCRHYGCCGGCDLQHGAYQEQLRCKQEIIQETLNRSTGNTSDKLVAPCLASVEQWHYRSRLRLQLNKQGEVGFFKQQSHKLVPIRYCPLAHEKINAALEELHQSGIIQAACTYCSAMELLLSPDDQTVTLLLIARSGQTSPPAILLPTGLGHIRMIACKTRKKIITLVQPAPDSAQQLHLTLETPQGQHTLSWDITCFSQVNVEQNKRLIELVCEMAGDMKGRTLLDLYCGMGNFSIPLALQGATVTGIEWNRKSIQWAIKNGAKAGVCCNFFSTDVQTALHDLVRSGQTVDTIILDPPRRGLGKATTLLPGLQPDTIIYISCDPATLARDVALLVQSGYTIIRVQPVDMFPQTHHIESVALLKKN